MPNIIIDLFVDRVDLVDAGANDEAHIRLYKRKENESMTFEEIVKSLQPDLQAIVNAEVAKAKEMVPEKTAADMKDKEDKLKKSEEDLAKAREDLAAANTEIAKAKPDVPMEDVLKSLSPEVQAYFKTMKAKTDASEAIAKEAMAAAENDLAIAKAKELSSIPVEEAKLVAVLKGISPEMHDILVAVNKAISTGDLFTEVGKNRSGNEGSTSAEAWAQIEKLADQMVAENKAKDVTITKAKAISEVTRANRDLYKKYLDGGAN